MSDPVEPEPKRIERVVLACVQCRSRHVKCDATQPTCNRCKREGKECDYRKSRRGGLDKAALARRRLRLQQEAESAQQAQAQHQAPTDQNVAPGVGSQSSIELSPVMNLPLRGSSTDTSGMNAIYITASRSSDTDMSFQVNTDRLLELFFENFWPAYPFVLPLHHLQQRRIRDNHGLEELLLVLQYIGSIYAPWTPSEPYLRTALQALSSPLLAHTPFNVQALMLFALAQHHFNMKQEAQKQLGIAIELALELGMNQRAFPQAYGDSNPVLEESWRRTYYMLHITDQHLAIVSNSPIYALANVLNTVDLPCDDEYFQSGQIPPSVSWQDYENREFEEVEVIYSSMVYLYDMTKIVKSVMDMFLESGTFGEAIIERCDTKIAIWTSLLPVCKRDPQRRDGSIDELMFAAHMIAVVTMNTMHRPFSSLALCPEELTTQSFLSPTPYVAPPTQGRGAHTARSLRALEMQTKLLAIPCAMERHSVTTMCMAAQLATAQISACKHLLDDHALSIARDRVRLSIGFLNAMGTYWPLGKLMAKEVRNIARIHLSSSSNRNTVTMESAPAAEIDIPRDEVIWPVNPSAQIDIYSGLMLPIDWSMTSFSYSSSDSPSLP
jgi:hypothetical protein